MTSPGSSQVTANEFSFSLSTYMEQRVCAGCGEPGSDSHHILLRSHGGEDDPSRNGLLLCHPCHMGFHAGHAAIQKDIGLGLLEYPDKVEYLYETLGGRANSYLLRYYKVANLTTYPGYESWDVEREAT